MPVPSINTNFRRSDGTDVSQSFISKDYLLSVYPSIASQLISPELWFWGYNNYGNAGDLTSGNRKTTPVTTFAGGSNWKQISSGYFHSAGIKTDGTLWLWGYNLYGQIGINNTFAQTFVATPVTTASGGTNWKSVSCGKNHTAAIKTDGTLWIWGQNYYGQLGNANTIGRSIPITTFAGGSNWRQVECGSNHTAAIKTDGTLWCWGQNYYGALGNGGITNRSTPITTFTGGTNWKQVSCGYAFTFAVKNDGTLWGFGKGDAYQLGNSISNFYNSVPINTSIGGTDWKQVSAGGYHASAIKNNGTLYCWGKCVNGQGGINLSNVNIIYPITTFAGGNNWKQVSCGYNHTMAIKTDGTLWSWGSNSSFQTGTGLSSDILTPTTTLLGGNNWKQISCNVNYSAIGIKSIENI